MEMNTMELSDLQFAVWQQCEIDSLNRCIDDILLVLMNYSCATIKHSDDSRMKTIHDIILQYKKELLKTEEGSEFRSKYNIDLYKKE